MATVNLSKLQKKVSEKVKWKILFTFSQENAKETLGLLSHSDMGLNVQTLLNSVLSNYFKQKKRRKSHLFLFKKS